MHNTQQRHLEGVVLVTGTTPTRAITLPVLPKEGAWSLTGQVIAVDETTPRQSVTFFPKLTGTCAGGVVTRNNTTKIPSQPRDGGRAQMWEPGGLNVTITGQQLEIEVVGIDGKNLLWAWSLDLFLVSLG